MSKIAAIQMCSSQNVDENLTHAAKLIAQAAAHGAKLAVLPEMFALIGEKNSDKIIIKETYGAGKIQDFLSALAMQHNIWIVAGTLPIACHNQHKVRAACIVFDHQGQQVARYDKIHLFDVALSQHEIYRESETTEPGTNVIVLNTPIGKLGLCVCYDLRFPQLFEQLALQGAEIIAVPAAFTMPTGQAHWELLLRSRAIDTFCYVVGACQGGVHSSGRDTYGHSMTVDPWGQIIDQVKIPGDGIAYIEVDLEKLYDIRRKIPVMSHNQ